MDTIKVLLVDDKQENLIALEALLKREDIVLYKTTSPNEALKLAWENDFAIALIDVQMPEMDGFELVRILKSNHKTEDILVIFVTAISKENKYAVKGLSEGAVDYLYKPLDPYITAAKVDSFIRLAKSQRELKVKNEQLERYSIMVDNSADIIAELDPWSYQINSINPAITKLLGYKPKTMIGSSLLDLLEEKDKESARKALEQAVLGNKKFASFESRFRHIRHEWIWMECRVNFHQNVLFVNMSDISAQKDLQHDLIRSRELAEQARKIKEAFLANMSHEIRTPINGIIGITHLLRETKLSEQQAHLLELISSSSESLLGVINDILDLSKIEAGSFSIVRSETNIRFLVKSVVDLLKYRADEKQISLSHSIDPNVPRLIFADSLRLNQILMNLAGNALKFTERGFVKISVDAREKKADKVHLRFIVEDTGIGIPPDKLSTIFESYGQAGDDIVQKYGGTGLGLTIVKKLADLKGGKLTVTSQVGKGSIFIFSNWYTVIESEQQEEAKKPVRIADLEPFDDLVVLLAEDNRINQFMACQLFERWNARVDVAENGIEALKMLQDKNYDIILMDTHMSGMDGYETARRIRKEFKGRKRTIPIISLSAAVLKTEQQDALAAGMDEVVGKPFDPIDLYYKVKKLTGK